MSRREQLQQLLQESPDDPFLLYALAMQERADGESETALNRLDQVLSVDSQYVAAYFQKGQILESLGRTGEARQVLQDGIAVARQVGDSHASGEMTEFLTSLT